MDPDVWLKGPRIPYPAYTHAVDDDDIFSQPYEPFVHEDMASMKSRHEQKQQAERDEVHAAAVVAAGMFDGDPEAEPVEEEILPPIMAPPAAAKRQMAAWLDFDAYLGPEPELVAVTTQPIPEVKHRHYSLAALKREKREKRFASRFRWTAADLERQRLMTMDLPPIDDSASPF